MKFRKSFMSLFVFMLLFVFLGCGSDNGGGDFVTSSSTPETKTKGYLIDSPLHGVTYLCDGNEGLTNEEGMFECVNAPVTFKVGNLTLGTLTAFTADGKVYPQDLLRLERDNYSNSRLKLLARLLQSLDDDGDIETKITITQSVRDALTKEQEFKDLTANDVSSLLSGVGKSFVNECGAMKHLGDKSVDCNSDGSYYVYVPSVVTPTPITSSKIKLLSPKSKVDYSYVTLEVEDSVADVKAKVNGVEYVGIKNDSSFFIYNVALKKGKNTVELIADNGSEKLTVELNSEDMGLPPIGLNANKREGFEKLDTTIVVETSLSANKYLFDKNNDGVTDEEKSSSSFDASYTQEGRFFPMATVQTSNGIWYSTQKNVSLDVKAKPTVEALVDLADLSVIDMQTFNYERYYVFAKDNNVYKIDPKTNKIIQTIPIAGVNNAEGFFVDIEENIYLANTRANQIIKLSKANGYQQTMSFGSTGSANGEFNQPKDLVVEGRGERQKIYVLDAGNNRVQVFNYVGAYLYSFDGSNTPTGKLSNPTSMVGYFAQPLTIVDSGNKVIRTLQCTKGQLEHEVSVIKDGISSDIGKITIDSNLIVPDKGAKKILFFQNNYWLKKSLDVEKVPNIAISHDGLNILVANEGENGIKELQIKPDPKGAEPIDTAKKFVQALIDGDRDSVEELLGYNERNINFIYSDQARLNKAIELYKQIQDWKGQTYHNSSYAIVKAHIKTATDEFDTTFELTLQETQIKRNRVWIVIRFY